MATPKKIREGVGAYEAAPAVILVGEAKKAMMELAAIFEKYSQSLKPAEQLGLLSELATKLEDINGFTQKQFQREITARQLSQPVRH